MKKLITFFALILILTVSAVALDNVEIGDAGYDKVYPSYSNVVMVEQNGKLGVVDLDGNIVVAFGEYDGIAPDRYGNTVIIKDDGSYVYSSSGELIGKYAGKRILSLSDGIYYSASSFKYGTDGRLRMTVEYFKPDESEILHTCENVVDSTPFANGYAAIRTDEKTYVIDGNGNEVYYDSPDIIPLAACGDGKMAFYSIDEDGNYSYYIVDMNAKKRICLSDFEIESQTNFTKTFDNTVKNVNGFYFLKNEDGVDVTSRDGVYVLEVEDPNTFRLDYVVVNGSFVSMKYDKIDDFNPDSKYLFYYDGVISYYYDVKGNKADADIECVTGFADGYAIAFDDDDCFVFVNEDFETVSESFNDVFDVALFGDVFCAVKDGKYHFISLSSQTDTPASPTPTTPTTPTTPSAPAKPEDKSGMHNFVKTLTYTDSVFPDVTAKDWFVSNVALAYETGLMNGKENGFDPNGKLTLAQVITMAARLHSIYNIGKADFTQGSVWYQVYVDYCVDADIIGEKDYSDYNRNATRAEFVRILAAAVPQSEFAVKNNVAAIPDVTAGHKDANSIFMFYRAGILAGSDSAHTFFPDSDITRAETAAIITRIIDSSLRLTF